MQELIQRLVAGGLTEEQANNAVEIVKNFAKDKFPMFAGAIDNVFDAQGAGDDDFLG